MYGFAQLGGGEGSDHLIGVHVAGGARPGLEDVDRKLSIVLVFRDFASSFLDRSGILLLQDAKCGGGLGGRFLDQAKGADQLGVDRYPRNRKVLNSALRLRLPQGRGGHPDLAHGVALDAMFARIS